MVALKVLSSYMIDAPNEGMPQDDAQGVSYLVSLLAEKLDSEVVAKTLPFPHDAAAILHGDKGGGDA